MGSMMIEEFRYNLLNYSNKYEDITDLEFLLEDLIKINLIPKQKITNNSNSIQLKGGRLFNIILYYKFDIQGQKYYYNFYITENNILFKLKVSEKININKIIIRTLIKNNLYKDENLKYITELYDDKFEKERIKINYKLEEQIELYDELKSEIGSKIISSIIITIIFMIVVFITISIIF